MKSYRSLASLFLISALSLPIGAQLPDAPSASKPTFPAGTKPAPKEGPEKAPEPAPSQPAPGQVAEPQQPEAAQSADQAPAGGDFRIRITPTLVVVPVRVEDTEGRPVLGIEAREFAVFENEKQQRISFFTSDPFPLSAAIVLDQGMSDTSMRKVNAGVEALAGAFAPYDEVALFTYTNVVTQRADWQAVAEPFSATLKRTKSRGRTGGVPVMGGPMASGPTVNGRPVDGIRQTQPVNTPVRESRVLNDAILRAANELATRERSRRKIIFVISDGNEDGSEAAYEDVLKVLLTNEISVYALGVDSAAIPLYQKVARARIPRFGTGNILPRYVSATGGQLMAEFSREAIERGYSELAGRARNQYTLGYMSSSPVSPGYRDIEVRVRRPNLRVFAKAGYYPLPPRR